MTNTNHYDVIIIGSGAGGGTLFWKLAPSGKRILLLERGEWIAREKRNWDVPYVVEQGSYHTTEAWRDRDGGEFHPGTHYAVGGNTKFYGAALVRLRREDFGEIRHHGGVSPAWPVGYDEFEPYYGQAEHLYHVHGQHGIDPTEPTSSTAYAHGPLQHEPRMQELYDDLVRIGHRPFPMPIGIMRDDAKPQDSACIRCNTCDGFPCLVNAKADAQVVCVDPTLRTHANASILTRAQVVRLDTDASGRRVSRVVIDRGGERIELSADVVVVSAGAINSAALLLRSANERHPQGLANGSGQVGRNYMCHLNSMLLAISRRPNPTQFQKTMGLNDFYGPSSAWDHPMGHISFVGNTNIIAGGAPSFAPDIVVEKMATHSIGFWLTSEDLPSADNRVLVDRDGRITLAYSPNNEEGHRRLGQQVKRMLKEIGCDEHLHPFNLYIGKRVPLAGVGHQNGTMRFGHDPRTSVLDPTCRAHDVENLYVVDASFFPSSGAVNPALTIMANALRVGDHLLGQLR